MAQLALGLAGAAVGFAIGGPAGAQWGFAIGTAAGGVLFAPKLPDGPRLNDRQVSSSAYGETIPRIYGTYVLSGNVIWATEFKETAKEVGGKGGGEQTVYTYSCSFAVSLCQGPIIGVRRIWADGKLFYDNRNSIDETIDNPPTTPFLRVTAGGSRSTLYVGTETQEPDPIIVSFEGDAPAYRGEAYIVFDDLPLERYGNRIPQLKFEVVTAGTSQEPSVIRYDWVNPSGLTYPLESDYHEADPQTGRIWFVNGQVGNHVGGVYDLPTKTWIKEIVSDRPTFNQPLRDILYVPPVITTIGISDRLMYVMSQETSPDELYLDVYNADSCERLRVITYPATVGGSDTFSCMVFNPVRNEVVCFRDTIFTRNALAFSIFSDVATPFPQPTEIRDAIFFSDYIVTISPFDDRGSISVCDPLLYTFVKKFNLRDTALGNQGTSITFIGFERSDPTWCVDTRRNRFIVFADGEYVGQPNKVQYWVFDSNVNLVETDFYNSTEALLNVTGTFYDEESDEIWFNTAGADYHVCDARTFTEKKILRNSHSMDYAKPVTSYPRNYISVIRNPGGPGSFINLLNLNPTVNRDKVTVASIVEKECLLAGLTVNDIDTTKLVNYSRGCMITGQGSIRGGLEALMNAYLFDCVESNGKLKFISRDKADRTTIALDDVAAHEYNADVPAQVEYMRADEIAQPKTITVKYLDFEKEYLQGAQSASRYSVKSLNEVIIEAPVTMRPGEAKQLALTALYSAWVSRTNVKFKTTWEYIDVEPTDIVTLDGNEIRITKKMVTGNLIEFEGALDTNTIYGQKPISGQSNVVTQTIQVNPITNALLLDIRTLRDSDSDSGFYVAAGAYEAGWGGAVGFKSIDNGNTFFETDVLTDETTIGTSLNALPAANDNTVDSIASVNVRLTNPSRTLSSVTRDALLNGANACLIGNEILQFQTATLNDDESYTLTNLLRSRRGTLSTSHQAGERFVLLDASTIVRSRMETSELNLPRVYKYPSIGTLLQNATPIVFTNTGQALKPIAPVHLGGGRLANGNLTINWIRCSRIGTEWRDRADVPLGETTESYQIDVFNFASPPAVVRTLTATTNTVTYTRAQQETDFGSPVPASIRIRVFQMSSTFGRGDFAEAFI